MRSHSSLKLVCDAYKSSHDVLCCVCYCYISKSLVFQHLYLPTMPEDELAMARKAIETSATERNFQPGRFYS